MKIINLDYTFENGKFRSKSVRYVIELGQAKYLNYFLTKNKDYRLNGEAIKLAQNCVDLKFNKTMVDILVSIKSNISNLLLELNTKSIKSIFTNIKASSRNKDSIVFNTPFSSNKGNSIKVGRFVKKLLEMNKVTQFTDVDIEEFVTSFYAYFSIDNEFEMKIVKGDEIKRLYHHDNYHKGTGTLGNSCMRYPHCQGYFELYVRNDEVSMLVLSNKKTGKITARAIIWEKTLFENGDITMKKPFMDRIYTNSNKHVKMFMEYAKKNDWIYKKRQSYSYKLDFVYNDVDYRGKMTAYLSNVNVNRPYLDTMAYIKDDGLTNMSRWDSPLRYGTLTS